MLGWQSHPHITSAILVCSNVIFVIECKHCKKKDRKSRAYVYQSKRKHKIFYVLDHFNLEFISVKCVLKYIKISCELYSNFFVSNLKKNRKKCFSCCAKSIVCLLLDKSLIEMSSGNCSVTIPVPPPPAIEFRSNSKECRYSQIAYSKSPVHFECDWASQVPEVQRASALAHVCMKTKPKFCRIKQNIKAVIQSGPTCGLTALKMLLGMCGMETKCTVQIKWCMQRCNIILRSYRNNCKCDCISL